MAITRDKVARIMDELRSSGASDFDSVSRIRKELGDTGSRGTIQKYRDEIITEQSATPVELPQTVLRALSVAWSSQCRKSLEDAVAMSEARVMLAEKKALETMAELSKETAKVKRLEEALHDSRKTCFDLKAESKTLRRQFEVRTSELDRSKGQVALLESQLKQATKRLEKGAANAKN